jgi:anthranilate phosphoribosyltransferase
LLQAINTESREGRKLASRLTTWSVFITKVDDTNRDLILQVAAFAEEDYNSHDLLESIARISAAQPQEALEIWRALLQGAAPDHPEWAIRVAFTNFVQSGDQGRRDAYSIADEYLKRGNENPTAWLQEIVKR